MLNLTFILCLILHSELPVVQFWFDRVIRYIAKFMAEYLTYIFLICSVKCLFAFQPYKY